MRFNFTLLCAAYLTSTSFSIAADVPYLLQEPTIGKHGSSVTFSDTDQGIIIPNNLHTHKDLREIAIVNSRVGGLENLYACDTVKEIAFAGERTLPKITFLTKEDMPQNLALLTLMDNHMKEFHMLSAPSGLMILSLENTFESISGPPSVSFLSPVMKGKVFQSDADWKRISTLFSTTVKDEYNQEFIETYLSFEKPSPYLNGLGIGKTTRISFWNDGSIHPYNLMDGYNGEDLVTRINNARTDYEAL